MMVCLNNGADPAPALLDAMDAIESKYETLAGHPAQA